MTKKQRGSQRVDTVKQFKGSTYQFVFAAPVRAGADKAFKLPSLVLGEQQDPKQRPAPAKGAVDVN